MSATRETLNLTRYDHRPCGCTIKATCPVHAPAAAPPGTPAREEDRLRAALRDIEMLIPIDAGSTHYEGCELNHPWCAVARVIRAALFPEGGSAEEQTDD